MYGPGYFLTHTETQAKLGKAHTHTRHTHNREHDERQVEAREVYSILRGFQIDKNHGASFVRRS